MASSLGICSKDLAMGAGASEDKLALTSRRTAGELA